MTIIEIDPAAVFQFGQVLSGVVPPGTRGPDWSAVDEVAGISGLSASRGSDGCRDAWSARFGELAGDVESTAQDVRTAALLHGAAEDKAIDDLTEVSAWAKDMEAGQ